MGALSNFLEEKLLNHLLRGTAYTAPGTVHVALFTVAPGETGGGTEVTGGSYARVAVAATTAQWSDPALGTQGETDNVNAITFPQATASWGTVVAVGVFDAAAAGNLLFYGNLTQSKIVGSGDTFQFAAGDLNLSLD